MLTEKCACGAILIAKDPNGWMSNERQTAAEWRANHRHSDPPPASLKLLRSGGDLPAVSADAALLLPRRMR